jgi:hypothetical protein
VNAPVEIEEIETADSIHPVFARSEFHQELFQNARIALAYSVQFVASG